MGRERAGLARAFLIFVVGLGAAGLLLAVLNGPFDSFVTASEGLTTSSQAAKGRGYITSYWDALPFIIAFLAFLQLLGAAAAEGRLR